MELEAMLFFSQVRWDFFQRKYLTSEFTHCLVRATVISHIDYCNSLLFKIPAVCIAKLQRIQNSAARLVYYIPRFEHITPVLYRLHWLPVSFRIEYKVLILTYKAIHGYAPLYISDLIRTRERTNYKLFKIIVTATIRTL